MIDDVLCFVVSIVAGFYVLVVVLVVHRRGLLGVVIIAWNLPGGVELMRASCVSFVLF